MMIMTDITEVFQDSLNLVEFLISSGHLSPRTQAPSWRAPHDRKRQLLLQQQSSLVHILCQRATEASRVRPWFRHLGTYPKKPGDFFWIHPPKKTHPKKPTLLLL